MRTKWIVFFVLFFSALSVSAKDLIPYQYTFSKGQIHKQGDQPFSAIDNVFLYLTPSEKGEFEGIFFYKVKPLKETPYLELRVQLDKGAYSVRIKHADEWVELGTIEGKQKWQRLKFDFTNGVTAYADTKNNIQIKIVSLEKSKAGKLDYMGISIDDRVSSMTVGDMIAEKETPTVDPIDGPITPDTSYDESDTLSSYSTVGENVYSEREKEEMDQRGMAKTELEAQRATIPANDEFKTE